MRRTDRRNGKRSDASTAGQSPSRGRHLSNGKLRRCQRKQRNHPVFRSLSIRQRAFLREKILGSNDKEAAIAAGYSTSVAENTKQKIWAKPGFRPSDDGLWFFQKPDSKLEVKIDSSTGMCPFLGETNERAVHGGGAQLANNPES